MEDIDDSVDKENKKDGFFKYIFNFFTYIKNYKTINSVDIYADSLNENKDKLSKLFSEFIFGGF